MIFINREMDRFIYNNEFDKDVIYNKLAKISSQLEEEKNKSQEERNLDRERELMYAQLLEGMKLNIFRSVRNIYF